MADLFGLTRERKIVNSGVRNVFTPHQPIMSVDLFLGRQTEVQRLIEYLNTPGQHALLFGDRGVGKSSLANIAAHLLLQGLISGDLIQKRCDRSDTFLSVVAEPLAKVGIDVKVDSTHHARSKGGKLGLSIPWVTAGGEANATTTDTATDLTRRATSPSWVARQLAGLNGLFVIDEVDALTHDEDKRALAELVKLMSDEGASLKLLLVGIAETAAELTAGHPSVQRCLRETRLSRMSNNDLRLIVEKGQAKVGLEFSNGAINRIVRVSSGYPHFTHLLCLKAAEDAIANDRTSITVHDLQHSTDRAVEDAEGTLKKQYEDAIRSYSTDIYKQILLAASMCSTEEFRGSLSISVVDDRINLRQTDGSATLPGCKKNFSLRLWG